MNKQKIIKQLDMIGKKVDIITEGYTKDQIEENIDFFIEQDKIKQQEEEEEDDDKELLSTCCGASALGNIHEFDGEHFGLCGDPKCKEHTDFKPLED
tara:strand:- start:66 stop:356 length:291 start_codon:yes stop_codon:yes gene_type:complete